MTTARSGGSSSAQDVGPAAGINADKVDGLNAVKSTGKKNKRKGKLMAFAASGYMPANIIKGVAATLAQLGDPTGAVNEMDNPVHWNQLQGVPPTIAYGLTLTFSQVTGSAVTLGPGANGTATAACPAGSVPVSGGHTASSYLVFNVSSFRTGSGWIIAARNTDAAPQTVQAIVHCVTSAPPTAISSVSIAKKAGVLKSATSNKPPTPKKPK